MNILAFHEHFKGHEPKQKNIKKIKTASAAGAAIGIAAAVSGVYAAAEKSSAGRLLKNFSYNEKDILLIGAGSILGGLSGGIYADKDNIKAKLKEASMQFFGCLLCPLAFLAAGGKLLEKSKFELPKLKGASNAVKCLNQISGALPKIAVTAGSLVLGMHTGSKIMNKLHGRIFKDTKTRDVHASDYLVHTDDMCTAACLLLKDSKTLSALTSKALPLSFLPAGINAGAASEEAPHSM